MENKKPNKKNTFLNTHRMFHKNNNSQMIVLTGVLIVISVVLVSSVAPDVANITISITSEKASTRLQEFISIKETFPYSLTYNLAENITLENNRSIYYGNISNITIVFNQTREEYRQLELKHDVIFDAKLHDYWVAHPGSTDCVYYLNATISLRDRNEYHMENVIFSIVCKPMK
jgi:hypothetical protein